MALRDDVKSRRHPEWQEFQLRWRWLQDSLEGGDRYRQAVYGFDSRGFPLRNLIRHKREYPDPTTSTAGRFGPALGQDQAAVATDDDYEMRRARTPVPDFLDTSIHQQLAKIYAQPVEREGPDDLKAWWTDADGKGTSIQDWMSQTIAPLLLSCGNLDVLFDRPSSPDGEDVRTEADVRRLGLDRCVASYILPENMLWWKLDAEGEYAECLVLERDDDGKEQLRHWTADGWTLYPARGEPITGTHPHGVVPIVRVFTGKLTRCENVGKARYSAIAECQREYYNRDSELILSDTLQAFPLLQGPEDFVQPDGSIPIGPGWLLPKKKNTQGGSATYEGFDVVDFPKGGAESIRLNMENLRDRIHTAAGTVKPAGSASGTVSQSGISKTIDYQVLHDILASVAGWLAQAERRFVGYALVVLRHGQPVTAEADQYEIEYPGTFDVQSIDNLATAAVAIQTALSGADELPVTMGTLIKEMVRITMPGREAEQYDEMAKEILAATDKKMSQATEMAYLTPPQTVPLPAAAVPGPMNAAGQSVNEAEDAGTDD